MNRTALACGALAVIACFACSPPSQDTLGVSASGSPGGAPWIDAAGPMFIEECSLGCGSGAGGATVSCNVLGVHVNEDIRVRFSRYVDLASVNPSSFRVRRSATGETAPGTFLVAPDDPRELIFRPALTFDADGAPIFGLEAGSAYDVFLPGTSAGDAPPWVRSQEGRANQSRLDCTVVADQGVLDYVPGPPNVSVLLDIVDPTSGRIVPDQPLGSGFAWVETDIRFVFDDVMNVATVVNPTTGEAPFLQVYLDLDASGGGPADLIPIDGVWSVEVQVTPPRTTAIFLPAEPLPSRGTPPDVRSIVLAIPPQLIDLVGNPLANSGFQTFFTELVDYPEVVLPGPAGETFGDDSNEDGDRSGAAWGGGMLTFGPGGGSGRLGELVVGARETLELATAGETFPLPGQPYDVLTNSLDPPFGWDPDDPRTWPTVTADASGLEFSRVSIEGGGLLRLSGQDAGRLFARGRMEIDGAIDASGESAADHRSNSGGSATTSTGILTASGGAGGAGGPNAGSGGKGGDRFDHSDNGLDGCQSLTMTFVGGLFIPESAQNPGAANDGQPGGGVGGEVAAAGRGGTHWPPDPPRRIQTAGGSNPQCLGDVEFNRVLKPVTLAMECRSGMVGGAGSGGGYALDGGEGVAFSPFPESESQPGLTPLAPRPTRGGPASELGLEPPGTDPPVQRDLDWHAGELRGGSGGGGGGFGLWGTKTNVTPDMVDCLGTGTNIFPYFDHSAAGGGGGGGAFQAVAGAWMRIDGRIDAAGGDGGGSLDPSTSPFECTNATTAPEEACGDFAAPGGGGSGGAIKLQARQLELSDQPARLSVIGGVGGLASSGSIGGDGSPGLVRIESLLTPLLPEELAPSIEPYYPGDLGFNQPYTSAPILSLGDWAPSGQRPDSFSAGMSCWNRADLDSFELQFIEDDPTAPDAPAAKGWNLDVLYETSGGVVAFPYRGIPADPAFPLTGTDFEGFLGQLLNHDEPAGAGSLFCVRFQGARAAGPLEDPCDVDLHDDAGEIEPGSLTPWVRHPVALNQFSPKPDMIRFVVVFDRSLIDQGPIQANIRGVTNLRIRAQPD